MGGVEQRTPDHRRSLTGRVEQPEKRQRKWEEKEKKKSIPRTGQKQVKNDSSNTESKKKSAYIFIYTYLFYSNKFFM